MYIIEPVLANFSDLSNVCNKAPMSLTFVDHCTVKGPKYDIFLCSPLKRTMKRDDTFAVDITTYIDGISTKSFLKYTGYPVKY